MESVKVGRDGKVRTVNVAYKILKDDAIDSWSHNVVTRPVRNIIKLFELNDTTFDEDMKAVHNAAKEILTRKGDIKDVEKIDEWPVAST